MTRRVLFDSITDHLELSLRSNDSMFNREWYIQNVGASIVRDFAPRYADIYMVQLKRKL